MKTKTYLLSILIGLLACISTLAQDRLGVPSALTTPIFAAELQESNLSSNRVELSFFQEGGGLFSLNAGEFMIGINSLLEEEVEPQFSIIDLFVYDASINYNLGDFGLYFGFENFINFGLQEAEVIPVPEFSNQIVSQITYELDSPFLISLGVTFTF